MDLNGSWKWLEGIFWKAWAPCYNALSTMIIIAGFNGELNVPTDEIIPRMITDPRIYFPFPSIFTNRNYSFWILYNLSNCFSLWTYSNSVKPIFHWKTSLRWVPDANEIDINNMKCTCPTRKFCIGDPTPPIFHWLASGVGVGGNANFRFGVGGYPMQPIFHWLALGGFALGDSKICVTWRKRYQHVGIFALGDAKVPNANSFASQWNIG